LNGLLHEEISTDSSRSGCGLIADIIQLRDLQINKLPVILENREQEEPFLAQTL
jgi:hypothetical protein